MCWPWLDKFLRWKQSVNIPQNAHPSRQQFGNRQATWLCGHVGTQSMGQVGYKMARSRNFRCCSIDNYTAMILRDICHQKRPTKRVTKRPTLLRPRARKPLVLLGFLVMMKTPQSASPAPGKSSLSKDWRTSPKPEDLAQLRMTEKLRVL